MCFVGKLNRFSLLVPSTSTSSGDNGSGKSNAAGGDRAMCKSLLVKLLPSEGEVRGFRTFELGEKIKGEMGFIT